MHICIHIYICLLSEYRAMHHTATHCNTSLLMEYRALFRHTRRVYIYIFVFCLNIGRCNTLQHIAFDGIQGSFQTYTQRLLFSTANTHCNTPRGLPHTATHTATHCNILRHTLQHTESKDPVLGLFLCISFLPFFAYWLNIGLF